MSVTYNANTPSALGTDAVVIGALAMLGHVAVIVGDWLSTNGVVR